jgi:hypothetical protein
MRKTLTDYLKRQAEAVVCGVLIKAAGIAFPKSPS